MAMMAGVLADGGCVGISVLTEPYFFGGSGADIARVKEAVSVPVLRKDFVIDMRQIAETKALGADAVLLIAAVLKDRPRYLSTLCMMPASNRSWKPIMQERSNWHWQQKRR